MSADVIVARRRKLSLIAIGTAGCLAYYLTIGGTTAGELLGWLRLVNSIVASAFIAAYVLRIVRDADRVDALVVLAFFFYAVASVTSAFPRQSLDAALGALAFVAIFSVGRRLLEREAVRRMTIWTLRSLSLVVTVVVAAGSVSPVLEWLMLTHGAVLPPVGLSFSGGQWGHRYDLLILALMLYPSWLIRANRTALVGAAAIGIPLAVAVLVVGSRAVWLGVALATVLALLPFTGPALRTIRRHYRWSTVAVAAAGTLLVFALTGPIADRLFTTATLGQRLSMWTASVDVWLRHPIVGMGPNSFPWVLQTTDYFATNSIHPRHPDSTLFQLLPEVGLVGLVAGLILLWAMISPLLRNRNYVALWPLGVFLFTGIGANPTDFSFLVVLAITWVALYLPPQAPLALKRSTNRTAVRALTCAALAPIALATVLTVAAGLYYDSGLRLVWSGELASAREDLGRAVSLDPAMALYRRQRGITSFLLDDSDAAIVDLSTATKLNPEDDLTWRALALVRRQAGDIGGAYDALNHALHLQRSDPTNLLLLASWQGEDANQSRSDTMAEIVLAWPTVLASPGWSAMTLDETSAEIVDDAIQLWEDGTSSPEPVRDQLLWLAGLSGRDELLAAAAQTSGESAEMVRASVAVVRCDPDADALLDAIPTPERRSSTYWRSRTQYAASRESDDRHALRLYELASNTRPSLDSLTGLDPLRENNPQGSVDAWGYDRFAMPWESPRTIRLPSPRDGETRWLLAPRQAWNSLRGDGVPALCSN